MDREDFLVSKCEEVKGNRTPDVQLKASQRPALEAFARCEKYLSTRDLVEEFVASGVWPLSWDWTTPKFGDKGPEGLCRPHPALQGFTGIIFYHIPKCTLVVICLHFLLCGRPNGNRS